MVLVRDFEQDRRTIQDRKDGYVTDELFLKYADERWPAALSEIDRLKSMLTAIAALTSEKDMQLAMAAEEAARGCCPYDRDKDAVENFCDESCEENEEKSEWCWIEYWKRQVEGASK